MSAMARSILRRMQPPQEVPPAPADPRPAGPRRRGGRLLALLLLAVAWPKVEMACHSRDPRFDGGYYVDIAQHVRDGDGLLTDVSMYHQGHPTLPGPTSVYPLWPLLLGHVARVVPMDVAQAWLPTLLYFGALLLAFGAGRRLFPGDLLPAAAPGVDAGHVLAALFAVNEGFFRHTTWPYTEGLAYCLLFAVFWRAAVVLPRPGWRAGAELGALLGLLVMTRSQLILAAVAAGAVWGVSAAGTLARRDRAALAPLAALGAAGAAAFVAVLAPWYIHATAFLLDPGPGALLRFDQARLTDSLAPLPKLVKTHGLWDYLRDRGGGAWRAFALTDSYSYVRNFGVAVYAVPVAAAVALAGWRRSPRPAPAGDPARLFVTLFAVAGLLSVHHMHADFGVRKWYFHWRHALPVLVLVWLSLVLLLRSPRRFAPAVAAALLCGSLASGYLQVHAAAAETVRASRKPLRYEALTRWIRGERDRRSAAGLDPPGSPPIFVVPPLVPQLVAWRAPGTAYHFAWEGTTWEELGRLVDKHGADYVVVPGGKAGDRFAFRRPRARFDARFRRVATNRSGFDVYAPP